MQFERKITKIGNSYAILLPRDLVKFCKLNDKNEVIIREEKAEIIIKKKVIK